MNRERVTPYPTELYKARLRLLHNKLLKVLTDPVSKTKINFLDGETLFHERIYSDGRYRISTPVRDLQSLPNAHSAFVILLDAPLFVKRQESEGNEARGHIIVVLPEVERSFLISAKAVEQQNPPYNINFLPTDPEVIYEIMDRRNIRTQPIKESVLDTLLGYVVNLERGLSAENKR